MRLGHVARAARANGHRLAELVGHQDQSAGVDRAWAHVAADARSPPEFRAGGRIVGDDQRLGGGDQLVMIAHADDDRRAPGGADRPHGFPDGSAALGVQGQDKRLLLGRIAALVVLQDHRVAVRHHGRGQAVTVLRHAQVDGPPLTAVMADAGHVGIGEGDVDALGIDRRRGGCIAGILHDVGRLCGHGTVGRRLDLCPPEDLAVGRVEAVHPPPVCVGRGQVDSISPDDGRIVALGGNVTRGVNNIGGPENVLAGGGVPLGRPVGLGHQSHSRRAAEPGPVGDLDRPCLRQIDGRDKNDQARHGNCEHRCSDADGPRVPPGDHLPVGLFGSHVKRRRLRVSAEPGVAVQAEHEDDQPRGQKPSAASHQAATTVEVFPKRRVGPPDLLHHLLIVRRGLKTLLQFGYLRRVPPRSVVFGEVIAKHRRDDERREDPGHNPHRQQHLPETARQRAALQIRDKFFAPSLAHAPEPGPALSHQAFLRTGHEAPAAGHADAVLDLVVGPQRHTAE